MLDLTPDEIHELEAEFARLTPEEKAMLEALAIALERSVNHVKQKVDETEKILEQSFARFRATDFARDVFGDNFKASRWLLTPNGFFKGKTPMSVIEEDDGPRWVIEYLRALTAGRSYS